MTDRRPLGNVLVATDFSAAATRAVERAARLPAAPGSALTVLHVLPAGCGAVERADAQRALARAVSVATDVAARVERSKFDVVSRLVEGTPFVEIIRSARHGRNELVVVGRHGQRRFRDLVLGSTAERVIRKGDTSILVVASFPSAPYERPLVAVDLSETSRRAIELAWRIVAPHVKELEVVHAFEILSESEIRRAGYAEKDVTEYHVSAWGQARAGVEVFLAEGRGATPARIVLGEGDARSVILDVVARHAPDLLALGTHGRAGLAHVFLGSVAEAAIRSASCDVLVARAVGLELEAP
jgi:nucleotide-binding universal stress UspA family protein